MKVGVVTASSSRQAGGLFWSVRALASGLQGLGCAVEVFSVADEFGAEDRDAWGDIEVHRYPRRGPAAFGYAPALADGLLRSGLDVLHSHGIWMYPSVASRRWGRARRRGYLISPRGMLDPWAVRHSRWKKQLAAWLYEAAHLRGAACIHALCEAEYQAIRAYGLRNPVAVIPNGVDLPVGPAPPAPWAEQLPDGSRVLLFLGRLHPKKGLANLLPAWAETRRSEDSASEPWHLVIAGWDQGGHGVALQRLSQELGIEASIHFVGPQFGTDKVASLARADAFVLPSFSEGLPMAVLEAWAHGLPALITPQCNLPEGYASGCSVKVEPSVSGVAEGLRLLFSLTETERNQMGVAGRALIEERFTWRTIAADMYDVYRWVNKDGPRPRCVIGE